jgi:hypothetical protein
MKRDVFIDRYIPTLYKFRIQCIAIIFVVWASYLRVRWFMLTPWIDGDDLWQISIMDQPFWDFMRELPIHEHGGYLSLDYLVIYPFFQIFGDNNWGLVIPHFALTLAGFYFLYKLARNYFRTFVGYVVAFTVVCFNIPLIQYASEIRVYAVLPTLALMSLYFAEKVVQRHEEMPLLEKFWMSVFFIIVFWFHAYGVLILFSTAAYSMLVWSRRSDPLKVLKRAIKFMVPVLVIALPVWLYCVFWGPSIGRDFGATPKTFIYIANPLVNPIQFLRDVLGNLIDPRELNFLLLGIGFPFLLPLKERFNQILFLLILIVMTISCLFGVVWAHKYYFLQRQFTWVVPFFALYLGWAWESFFIYVKGLRFFRQGKKE